MRGSGRHGSADFFPHRRRETSGEGQSRRAATLGRIGGESAADVRGKFSSSARRAHVYAYAGLDRGRQAARGRWGLALEGILLLPSTFGKTLCLGSLAEGRIRPRIVQPPAQTPATKQGVSSSALPPTAPGWLGCLALHALGPPLSLPRPQ